MQFLDLHQIAELPSVFLSLFPARIEGMLAISKVGERPLSELEQSSSFSLQFGGR
jgi:hypothetical protein